MFRLASLTAACLAATLACATPAGAQTAASGQDDDAALTPAEPDVVVVNLPTSLRLPRFKGNFRLTHRFAGNLRNGTFGQQAGNLFGIDQGAIIGFEYRIGIAKHVQAAFYRSSFDKTIQLHAKYDALRQRGALPVSISALVSVEGTDNFQEKYAPAVGVVVSRRLGTRIAAYVTPMWVHNTAASLDAIEHSHDAGGAHGVAPTGYGAELSHDHRDTTYAGVGGRLRFRGSAYVAGELVLRAGGYAPDKPAYGVSVEKRVGAHMFSLTFTNTFATTFAQLARGGAANTLYLGFNLGRKFF
ncbi:MAG TPA: DUF5777 family beta-barrel protein [Vicinamibacterales bacterium]|nr:DUF5777 family beta-barrel protein [Vicinamibacterales bacterium]